MRKFITIAIALGATVLVASSADARQGCGLGFHRNFYGYCRPNRRPVYAAPVLVVGRFYPGRGYWDGRRYWQHRERWHNGWRYR